MKQIAVSRLLSEKKNAFLKCLPQLANTGLPMLTAFPTSQSLAEYFLLKVTGITGSTISSLNFSELP